MRCPKCGTDNTPDSLFCTECGARLEALCPACGAPYAANARFCRRCGGALGEPGHGTAAAPRDRDASSAASNRDALRATPAAYTPKHLADRILTSRAALEGERKQVTVLFADVKGSLELAEQVDPEEWHGILDRFFHILADGVHRYEGTINQYTGDGIMALFGAPLAHEDHAHRACWAALTLRDDTRRYADELRLGHGLNFSVRMGINSGEVVVGKIGDDLRMDYTAQGHTVGLAARMEQLAEPGSVFLTDATAHRVDGFFQLRDLGPSTLKGVRDPLHVYALEGVGRLRTRLDLSRARGLSRFVGRASEMRTLEGALEQALAGNGQIVGAVGDAGVGKSRLCYEFIERCRTRGITVHQGHCVAHGKLLPLVPILELLREVFGLRVEDDACEARRKIAGTLVLLADEVREVLSLIFDMMGVPDPEEPSPAMDPDVRQRRVFEFVKRIVRARSARESVVLFLDDLHWIDAASDAYLANLVEAIRGTRTLMLLNFRPEYRAPWMATSYYQQLPLAPLGPEAITELLGHLLGMDPSVQALAARIQERADGNPFFVEEIVQGLVEAGSLAGTRGAYRLTTPIEALAIPPTVQAILAARIDRLPEREKRVLQAAAVIGRVAPEPLLERVLGLAPAQLGEALRALVAGEFLYEDALYPEAEYAFKHPLTREVAYGAQLGEQRQRMHMAVARAMVELAGERLDERAAIVAHHFESAGAVAEAADWHSRAARWVGLRDSVAAHGHWGRAFELARAAPESPETTALALTAYDRMCLLGIRVGMSVATLAEAFESASALARRAGNEREGVAVGLRFHGVSAFMGGPLSGLFAAVAEAKGLAARSGDRELELAALVTEAIGHYVDGRVRDALPGLERGIELLGGDPHIEFGGGYPLPRQLFWKAFALALLGFPGEAERAWERMLAAATEIRSLDPDILPAAHALRAGYLTRWTGRPPAEALVHGRQAVELAEREGSSLSRVFAYVSLARASLLNGDWEGARAASERVRTLERERGTAIPFAGSSLASDAQAWLGLGDLERARTTATEAVARASARESLWTEIEVRIARARVLAAVGERSAIAEARADLARATTLVEETGARLFAAYVYEAEAGVEHAVGDEAARAGALRAAHRLYTEMGITGHAERVAKEIPL